MTMRTTLWLKIMVGVWFGWPSWTSMTNAFLLPTTFGNKNKMLIGRQPLQLYEQQEERIIVEDRFAEEEREAIASSGASTSSTNANAARRLEVASSNNDQQEEERRHPKEQFSKQKQAEEQHYKIECPKLFRDFYPGDIPTLDSTIQKRAHALTKIRTMQLLTAALHTWAKARNVDDAAERCYQVLQHLRTHGTEHGLVANEYIFNVVIDAFGRRNQPERAESIFREMIDDPTLKPTGFSFNSVLRGYARSHAYGASKRCIQLLEEMKTMDTIKEGPSRLSYNIVLDVLAKRGQAQQATKLLQEMMQKQDMVPDTTSYNSVLHAWSNSKDPDATDKCLKLFREMDMEAAVENFKCKPDTQTYSIVIDALAQRGRAREAEEMVEEMSIQTETPPDTVTFNSLLNAYSRSNDTEAPRKAMHTISMMHAVYKKDKDMRIRPDVVSYNTVIATFANHGHARDAELVVHMMLEEEETVDPDSVSFCTAIKAWSRSKDKDATDHCLQLLQEQKQFSKRTRVKRNHPNVVTYNCVMNAFAQRGMPLHAERLLHEMLQEKVVFPNTITFNTVMNAWAKAEDKPNAPDRCMQLLSEMESLARKYGRTKLVADEYTKKAIHKAFAKYGRAEEVAHLVRNSKTSSGKKGP